MFIIIIIIIIKDFCYTVKNVFCFLYILLVWHILQVNKLCNQSSNPRLVVCISHSANTMMKGMVWQSVWEKEN